ncbi:MAG: lysylphosphatidylglycerol synthase transmembrane domain-containing protein [Pseudomonadota bacterium]|nr:TIGR00374 family protein [Pseudomonadales bacterium]MDY6919886.1 lysylphosphatidylglycerol synthase transmembrane domain-containing protein [Pseudomonadota bacterium]
MGRFQKPIILSVIVAIGLYFGAMFLGDFQETGAAIARVGLAGWLVILSLSLLNYALRYWRWEWYLTKLSTRPIPHRRHLAYYVSGFALSTTPGKAGETIRSLYLKQHGIGYSVTISTFFVERFQDLLTIVLMASAAAVLFEGYNLVVVLTAAVVFGSLPVLHSRWLMHRLERATAVLPQKFANLLGHLLELLKSSAVLLKNKELLGGIALGITAWVAEGIGFWYLLECLGQDVTLLAAVGIYGVAVLVGAISFLPGGLGSTEAVMGLLLISIGVPEPVAIAATLICRIATLWFAVFIGLIVAGALASRGIVPVAGSEMTKLG